MRYIYIYYIVDDKISDEFNSIKDAARDAVNNIYEYDIYVYNDKYILVEIMESEDYDDGFRSRFIELLEDIDEDAAHYDGIDDYLDGVDKDDFANQITEIWNKYKKDKGIRGYYKAKNTAPLICKIRVNKDRYGDYSFVGYDIYRHDETE